MLKVRNVKWVIENPRALVDSFKQQKIKAIIEQVRDGSTVRAFLLPDFYYITLMLSGIKVSFLLSDAISSVINFHKWVFVVQRVMVFMNLVHV